jgi:hypothetical protein
MARNRHCGAAAACPLSEVKRKHLLGKGISPFDPERSSAAVFGNEVDIDQHLMMCIVDTVKMMLAVSSLEISTKG